MHAERIDNLHCHRLIRRLRKCASNNIFQLLACDYNTADGRVALKKTVRFYSWPVVIKRYNARSILRHSSIENALNSGRYIFQDMTVLNQIEFVKNINVRRMNREQIYELIQAGGHACIETAELFQMIANQCFLLRRLLQNTLGNDIGSCFLRDNHLRETVTDMLERISNKTEFRIVKNLLLHTEHHAQ